MKRKADALVFGLVVSVIGWGLCLGIVFDYRGQVRELKSDIYTQCVQRQTFDASAQEARRMFRSYYLQQIEQETHNRFIDDALRAQRIANTRTLIAALEDTLGKSVRSGCAQYKP